jgi:hypothetical protein
MLGQLYFYREISDSWLYKHSIFLTILIGCSET